MSREVQPNTGDVEQWRATILASVRRRCPGWLAADAEDIAQAAVMRILEIRRRDGGTTTFGTSYLERVAYTAMIDAIRARFRRREVADLPGEEAPESGMTRGLDSAVRIDLGRALRECLATLVPPRRAAVACRLLGHSAPETATLLGWTAKKAEHLVGRGLHDLRDCLVGKGVEP